MWTYHVILLTNVQVRWYQLHFVFKETGLEKLSHLSKSGDRVRFRLGLVPNLFCLPTPTVFLSFWCISHPTVISHVSPYLYMVIENSIVS